MCVFEALERCGVSKDTVELVLAVHCCMAFVESKQMDLEWLVSAIRIAEKEGSESFLQVFKTWLSSHPLCTSCAGVVLKQNGGKRFILGSLTPSSN